MPANSRYLWVSYIINQVFCIYRFTLYCVLCDNRYCYMGHEVFPAIFHHMRHPQYFTFVVSIAFTSMLLCYATIATLGYLVYGITASGNIMDNLPPNDVLTVCIKVCIIVTVLAKLTLCAAPLSEGIHEWTRLLLYLTNHWLCPSVRLSSTQVAHTPGTIDTADTVVLPAKRTVSKYGTYRSSPSHVSPWQTKYTFRSSTPQSQSQSTFTNLTTKELDLNLAADRRKYFNTAYFDVAKEVAAQHSNIQMEDMDLEECNIHEMSPLLPTDTTQQTREMHPVRRGAGFSFTAPINTYSNSNISDHCSVLPYPPAPLVSSVTTLNVTSPMRHKELTWSEPLLIIPPIRSPPCGKVLSSSIDETTQHSTHVPYLTPGQALVQQEGELVSEDVQSQSLGHSLSALTELLGTTSSARVVRTSSGDSIKANTNITSSTSFKPLLTLLNPDECNNAGCNNIHSDSDSSSSLETIDMWYTKEDVAAHTIPVTKNTTAFKDVTTQHCTSFDSPTNHTQLPSFTQYQQQLHQHRVEQESADEANVTNRVPATAGEYSMIDILPIVIRCTIPIIALGIASLFDSFVSMVIFTGGVCGGSVSIVIPTYAYYNIHYRELYAVEKLFLVAVIIVGAAMAFATPVFVAL